jgi:amidase
MNDLIRMTARAAVQALRRGDVSPLELIDAAAARIAAADPMVNALPTLCLERARDRARRMPRARGTGRGWLGGLPIAVKDLNDVAGVRTTYGSPIFADHVPARSDILVETLEARGAIVVAKSNTPEFGHGANTFNEVFGKTRNPWNTALTCGGSSGGSAVGVATGQTWLATGSDFGCSLRTPAAFCAVVGLRPSPGRVARGPLRLPFNTLWVEGPMARTVGDAALMLDAMVGTHPEDPLSKPAPTAPFVGAVERPRAPARVGWSPDLGGLVPVAREIRDVCGRVAARFHELGASVEEATPDLHDAREIFHVLRAQQVAADLAPLLERHRSRMKPEVVWNIEQGAKLTADEIGRAERARAALYYRVAKFFEAFDLLVSPATIVAPFPVDVRYITEVEGHRFENYFDWYTIAYAITITGCPALVLPCGFTAAGLPVGLQLVGRPHGEAALLGAGALFEELAGIARCLPIDPRPPAP